MNKKRSNSSNCWLRRHFNDKYVKLARKDKLYSRAWFKLAEIQQSDKIFKPKMTVVDLGASPGGWSQYAMTQIGKTGQIIACDLLPMSPITGVIFLKGDFRDRLILNALLKLINDNKVHVVMSDMAPNISGIPEIDISRAMCLAKLALNVCRSVLKLNGSFITKVFYGECFEEYVSNVHSLFTKVKIRKPNSSRVKSRETYVVATGYKS